jgi:hypothetical protein
MKVKGGFPNIEIKSDVQKEIKPKQLYESGLPPINKMKDKTFKLQTHTLGNKNIV